MGLWRKGRHDLMGSRAAAVSVEGWRDYVLSLAGPQSPRRWPLREAEGCILADPLRSRHPLPPFDSSAMDGYAVRAADVAGACEERPVRLRIVGSAPAGSPTAAAVGAGQAVRVLTGGVVPSGADAVVPVEGTDAGRQIVAVRMPVPVARHIRRTGEDAPAGTVIASPGTHIGPGLLAAAAAAGHADLLVVPSPRVLVVSTGNELAPPGAELSVGLIPDANGVGVAAATRAVGAQVLGAERCADVPVQLRALLAEHVDRVDLVVTTGGISAGAENDVVRTAFEVSGSMRFAEVAMRPGAPQAAGYVRGRPVVGLPGNPVAAAVSFAVFVRPLLRQMRGLPPLGDWGRAQLSTDVARTAHTRFLLGRWRTSGPRRVVDPHARAGSHLVSRLADADVLIRVPPGSSVLSAGSPVDVLPLDGCR